MTIVILLIIRDYVSGKTKKIRMSKCTNIHIIIYDNIHRAYIILT